MEENLIEVKKKNKILPLIIVILVIILLAGGGYYYYTNYYNKNTTQEVEKPRLEDDFYDHFNTKSSPFYNAQEQATLSSQKIVMEIDADTTYDNKEYRNYNKLRIEELYRQGYFKTDEEFGKAMMWLLEEKPIIPNWLEQDMKKISDVKLINDEGMENAKE